MTKPVIIALVVTAMVALIFWQSASPPLPVRIKIENDGGIVNGHNQPAAAAMPYDPYYIHVNDTPHIQLSDAELFALASRPDDSPNRHPRR